MANLTTDSPVSDMSRESQTRIFGIFAKAWDAGKVKTRLAKTLGDETAAQIYFELIVLHLLRFAQSGDYRVVAYSPISTATRVRFENLIQSLKPIPDWKLEPQFESDLGTRMSYFFQQHFDSAGPRSRVVLVGSDAPRLTTQIVEEAFESLNNHDAVFGPSSDGGYYLVGLSRSMEAIFKGIEWSTENVLSETLAICKSEGLSVAMLPELTDIDNEADLKQELQLLSLIDDTAIAQFLENISPLLKGKLS